MPVVFNAANRVCGCEVPRKEDQLSEIHGYDRGLRWNIIRRSPIRHWMRFDAEAETYEFLKQSGISKAV